MTDISEPFAAWKQEYITSDTSSDRLMPEATNSSHQEPSNSIIQKYSGVWLEEF